MNPGPESEWHADEMLDRARRETGLHDLGEAAAEEGLRCLIASANQDVDWTPAGRMAFPLDVHRLLINRLRTNHDLRRHPEIQQEDVGDPVVILGLMRTGTTKLQRMLAATSGVQRIEYWRMYNTAPFPGAGPGGPDPRIAAAEAAIQGLRQLAPDFMAGHPTDAREVDEEVLIQLATFRTTIHYMFAPVHGYQRWVTSQDLRDTYAYLKTVLQYLQWQDGGRRERPWILKSPVHLGHLDALHEKFPRATVVHCHRDVAEVIPSFCRLMETIWSVMARRYDPATLGDAVLEMLGAAMRRYLVERDRLSARLEIFDVRYESVVRRPLEVAREIYRRRGRPLSGEDEQRMLAWCAENPADRYGAHRYTLERFGLTRRRVEEAFGEYLTRFSSLLNPSQHPA